MPDVVGHGPIGLLEHARLLAQALQVAGPGPPRAARGGRRQLGGELPGEGLQASKVERIATRDGRQPQARLLWSCQLVRARLPNQSRDLIDGFAPRVSIEDNRTVRVSRYFATPDLLEPGGHGLLHFVLDGQQLPALGLGVAAGRSDLAPGAARRRAPRRPRCRPARSRRSRRRSAPPRVGRNVMPALLMTWLTATVATISR